MLCIVDFLSWQVSELIKIVPMEMDEHEITQILSLIDILEIQDSKKSLSLPQSFDPQTERHLAL